MADALLKLPDDSGNAGKQLDTTSLTVSAQTVHRERMNIAGSTAAALAEVLNSAPSSEYALVVRNIPSGTQNVRPTDGTNAITATFDVDTGAGTQYLEGVNLRISGSGGSIEAKGQQAMASSIPVVLASDQASIPVAATLAAETTKVIGTVNQGTSPWVNNTSQINGVTPLMGNGVTGTGSQRVTIASDNTAFSVNATLSAETTKVIGVTRSADGSGNLLTSTSNALDVNLKSGSIANTGFGLTPQTSGGCSISHAVSAGSTNATSVKASAGQVYGWTLTNNAGYPVYAKLHNTAGTPTAGSGVVRTIGCQAGVTVSYSQPAGIAFGTGIGYSIVKDITDAGTTAVLASDCVFDLEYK